MKAISFILLIALLLFSCKKINTTCMQGTVIGKIRSAGGGWAVSLNKNYKGAVNWKEYKNVVEVLNIPKDLKMEGATLYFSSREATGEEQGPITADGFETIKTVLFGLEFSATDCP